MYIVEVTKILQADRFSDKTAGFPAVFYFTAYPRTTPFFRMILAYTEGLAGLHDAEQALHPLIEFPFGRISNPP